MERSKVRWVEDLIERVKWPGLTLLSLGTMEVRSRYWEEENKRKKKKPVKHGR